MNLHDFDLVVLNSSGGKDSLAMIKYVCDLAYKINYPKYKIVISHQCLGESEWKGVKDLVYKQADMFGLEVHISSREKESLLQYVERRGMWPGSDTRWCTSDFKRAPGYKLLRKLRRDRNAKRVLNCYGFRAEESPARSKRTPYVLNKSLSFKDGSNMVYDWLPIHQWTVAQVWQTIKGNGLPYHKAYDLGMPRLSCVFCVFSPFDALVLAGQNNKELLDKYVEAEKKIGHTFRKDTSIASVKEAIEAGYTPKNIKNWIM